MLENQAEKIQYIWCGATISKKMEDVLISFFCKQAQESEGISEYVVYLSTPGCSPLSAVNLYKFIKSIPQKTTVYNMGNVSSAGVPFFLGFKNRRGFSTCIFIIHQTTISRVYLPEQFDIIDIDAQKALQLACDFQIQQKILKENQCKCENALNLELFREAIQNTATYNTNEALRVGVIELIESPCLPEEGVLYLTGQVLATQTDWNVIFNDQ